MSERNALGDQGYREDIGLFGPGDTGKSYYGKYRGAVVNNVDPYGQGRLMVRVPGVTGLFVTSWALPCFPMTGPAMGAYFVPPPVGASVWVEFEQGDPDKPIWVGSFLDLPVEQPGKFAMLSAKTAPGTPVIALETLTSGVVVSDVPLPTGTVNLYSGPSTMISMGPQGITMTAPQVNILTTNFNVNGVQFMVI